LVRHHFVPLRSSTCQSDFDTGTIPSLSYLYSCHFVGCGETCIASSAAGRCWKSSFEVDSFG